MTRPPTHHRQDADPTNAPFPFPTTDVHDAPPPPARPVAEEPTEDALDHGIEESFPASDPVSVTVTKVIPKHEEDADAETGGAA